MNIDKSKAEVLAKLFDESNNSDTETAHGNADTILCDFLIELGYQDIVDAYNEIDKWYT